MQLYMKELRNFTVLLQEDNFHYRSQLIKQAVERPPTIKGAYGRNKEI